MRGSAFRAASANWNAPGKKSGPNSFVSANSCKALPGVEPLANRAGQPFADPRHGGEVLERSGAKAGNGSEPDEQDPLLRRADAADAVQRPVAEGLCAALALVAAGEPMGF